jgi:uncharacterized protein YukJ
MLAAQFKLIIRDGIHNISMEQADAEQDPRGLGAFADDAQIRRKHIIHQVWRKRL